LIICHWLVIEFRRHLAAVGVIGWGQSARLLGAARAGVNMVAITTGLVRAENLVHVMRSGDIR
jgi:hypothetical protein